MDSPNSFFTSAEILILHDCLSRELERLDLGRPRPGSPASDSVPDRVGAELIDMRWSLLMMGSAEQRDADGLVAIADGVEGIGADYRRLERDMVDGAAADHPLLCVLRERLGEIERQLPRV